MKKNISEGICKALFLVIISLPICASADDGASNSPPHFSLVANFLENTISTYLHSSADGQLRHVGIAATGSNPRIVIVEPKGQFAYVTNSNSKSISMFAINATTGLLTPLGTVAAGAGPSSAIVDPSGKFFYVANSASNDISAYSINNKTGALTSIGTVATEEGPYSIAITPSGKYCYVANYNSESISSYSINTKTGALTPTATLKSGGGTYSIAIAPSGKFAYVANATSDNVWIYSINTSNGVLTPMGSPVATGRYPNFITVEPSGHFAYVSNMLADSVSAYVIDNSSGSLTPLVGEVATGSHPETITVDPTGKYAYVMNMFSANISAYAINFSTGALAPQFTVTGQNGNAAMSFIPSSQKNSSNDENTRSTQQNSRLASKLKGAWIIDPKATENLVLSATPPPNASKLAEWFGLAGGYLALFTYEFNGDAAIASAYRGSRILEFQVSSQQNTEIKYSLKNDTSSPAKTLSVSLLNNGNIKIVPSEAPEMGYLLWKRGSLKTEQATPDDVMAASKTWLVSIQNIVEFLNKPPEETQEPPISIETENPHPALEAAIRNGIIRRVKGGLVISDRPISGSLAQPD